MSSYQLSPLALSDVEEILLNRAEHSGEDVAARVQADLFAAFGRLAPTPGLGHRRSDLTRMPYFFYALEPYLVVYSREVEPLPIVAVLHGSRDVRKVLRGRLKR